MTAKPETAASAMRSQGQRALPVVLLAYDGMNLLDLAGPLQALTTANRSVEVGAPPRYDAIVASAQGGVVVTGSGLPLVTVPVSLLADAPIDTLIAPGGCPGETYEATPELRDFIAARAASVRRPRCSAKPHNSVSRLPCRRLG